MVPLHGSWANVESGKWNVLFCPSQAFLLAARALGANQILSGRVPDGLLDNNPAFQRRERVATGPRRQSWGISVVPTGLVLCSRPTRR